MHLSFNTKLNNIQSFKGSFLIHGSNADIFTENKNKILPKNIAWNFNVDYGKDKIILTTKYDIQRPIDSKIRNAAFTNSDLSLAFRTDKRNVLSFYNFFDFKLIKKLSLFKIDFEYSPIKLSKENYKNEKAYQRDFNMLFHK